MNKADETALNNGVTDEEFERFILLHEFGHMYDYTYESGDHYDDPDKETGLCSSYCTYGSLTNDLTEMMMCTACKTRIMGNAGRFKHPLKEVTQ